MSKSLGELIKTTDNVLFKGILEEFYSTTSLAIIDYEEADIDFDVFEIELPNFEDTVHIDNMFEMIKHRIYLLRAKLSLLIWKKKYDVVYLPKNSVGLFLEDDKILFRYKLGRREK